MRWQWWLATTLVSATGLLLEDAHLGDLSLAKHTLIYFFLETCKYCQQFDPTFTYIDTVVPDLDKLRVFKVNGKANPKLVRLFGVNGYPTVKFLTFDTKKIDSVVTRDFGVLASFLEEATGVEMDYSRYSSSVRPVLVPFLLEGEGMLVITAPWCDGWEQWHYPSHDIQRLAANQPIYVADLSESWDILSQLNISNWPAVIKFKDGKAQVYPAPGVDHARDFIEGLIEMPWVAIPEISLGPDGFRGGYGMHADLGKVQVGDDDDVYAQEVTRLII